MFIVGGVIAPFLIKLLARRRVGLDIGGGVDPYMRRRYVIPRNKIFNIYCHEIRHDDDDRALHDHPWPNLSIVLSGGYRELVFVTRQRHGHPLPAIVEKIRWAGSVVGRRAGTAHRLALHRDGDGRPVPAWTLFITGPVLRDWGFWCGHGPEGLGRWVHWRLFTVGERGEIVGAGCGEGHVATLADERRKEGRRAVAGNPAPCRCPNGVCRYSGCAAAGMCLAPIGLRKATPAEREARGR